MCGKWWLEFTRLKELKTPAWYASQAILTMLTMYRYMHLPALGRPNILRYRPQADHMHICTCISFFSLGQTKYPQIQATGRPHAYMYMHLPFQLCADQISLDTGHRQTTCIYVHASPFSVLGRPNILRYSPQTDHMHICTCISFFSFGQTKYPQIQATGRPHVYIGTCISFSGFGQTRYPQIQTTGRPHAYMYMQCFSFFSFGQTKYPQIFNSALCYCAAQLLSSRMRPSSVHKTRFLRTLQAY